MATEWDGSPLGRGVVEPVEWALQIVNDLMVNSRQARSRSMDDQLHEAYRDLGANERVAGIDLATVDVSRFGQAAERMHAAVEACLAGDLQAAGGALDGIWMVHRRATKDDAVGTWAATAADGLVRLLRAGQAGRVRQCPGPGCREIYLDTTDDRSRGVCSQICAQRLRRKAVDERRKAQRQAAKVSRP